MIQSIRSHKNLYKILFDECDPEKFVKVCRRAVEHPLAWMNSYTANEMRLNLSMGLKDMGSFEEAAGMLNNVQPFKRHKRGLLLSLVRCGLKSELLIHFKNIEDASKERPEFEKIAHDIMSRIPSLTQKMRYSIEEFDIALRFAEGNIEGAEEFFTSSFNNAKNEHERVASKYDLGLVYLLKKDQGKALDEFRYVYEHGNKLFIAREAKRLIEEQNKQEAAS